MLHTIKPLNVQGWPSSNPRLLAWTPHLDKYELLRPPLGVVWPYALQTARCYCDQSPIRGRTDHRTALECPPTKMCYESECRILVVCAPCLSRGFVCARGACAHSNGSRESAALTKRHPLCANRVCALAVCSLTNNEPLQSPSLEDATVYMHAGHRNQARRRLFLGGKHTKLRLCLHCLATPCIPHSRPQPLLNKQPATYSTLVAVTSRWTCARTCSYVAEHPSHIAMAPEQHCQGLSRKHAHVLIRVVTKAAGESE